uniref:Uncharacterized protein n=1 Tax=Aegilops tauschii subsp. strangulata TaxID=200361 RepID=A0A452YUU2_AEGTS
MGLVDSVDGLQYTRMSMLTDQQTLEEQRSCIREEGLITPQDHISMLV